MSLSPRAIVTACCCGGVRQHPFTTSASASPTGRPAKPTPSWACSVNSCRQESRSRSPALYPADAGV